MKHLDKSKKTVQKNKTKTAKLTKTVAPHDVDILQICNIIFVMVGRIPGAFNDFNTYITYALAYLREVDPNTGQTNGERLGMSPADVALCATYLAEWSSNDTLNPAIYERHADKKKKNVESRTAVDTFRKKINKWFLPILNQISANKNITGKDRLTLNIRERPTKLHRKGSKIEDIPDVFLKPSGRGNIILRSLPKGHDCRKPKLGKNADCIEIRYAVVMKEKIEHEKFPKRRDTAPENVEECFYSEIHSKAMFNVDVGSEYSGGEIYLWARYSYMRRPNIAGSWSQVAIITLP